MNPLLPALLLVLLASSPSCGASDGASSRRIVACRPSVALAACRRMAESRGLTVYRELPSINAVVVEAPRGAAAAAAEASVKADATVDFVEPDRRVNWLKATAARAAFEFPREARDILRRIARLKPAPSDPEQPWGVRRVGAARAWAKPRGRGEGVSVAVIDTGVSRSHPDLAGVVAGGVNVLTGAKADAWDDDQGHGSHVAGTIAARRDGSGVVGVAPSVKLYAVKVLDSDGHGDFSDVVAGLEWAAARRIPVANMSLGAAEGSEALKRAVAAAVKGGMTIVAAAGNSGGPVGYPGAYPEVIAVAASDAKDGVADFSSRGPEVDFIAPGVAIKSVKMDGGFADLSGTSMAAPHVAGLAAIAVARGAKNPAQARAALEKAASPLPGLGAELQGAGMIDAARLP